MRCVLGGCAVGLGVGLGVVSGVGLGVWWLGGWVSGWLLGGPIKSKYSKLMKYDEWMDTPFLT